MRTETFKAGYISPEVFIEEYIFEHGFQDSINEVSLGDANYDGGSYGDNWAE